MLTRFEVSGFKNLRDVVVDFGPFTCIAGPNGVGKSNLFDAIQLLSALSRTSFSRAFGEIRAGGGQRGTVRSMLSPRVLAGEENLRLAAELIVPGSLFNGRLRAFPGNDIMMAHPYGAQWSTKTTSTTS